MPRVPSKLPSVKRSAPSQPPRKADPPTAAPEVIVPPAAPAPPRALPSDAPSRTGRTRLRQWTTLLFVLTLLASAYAWARDILYTRIVYGLAQEMLNSFATGTVSRLDHVEMTPEGNIRIHGAEVVHRRPQGRRTFYRAERIDIALDAWPFRERPVYVSRVDLFHPEIWVIREQGGNWNIVWALQAVPGAGEGDMTPEGPPSPDDAPPHPARGGWPRNGVHIHDGIIHVVFIREDGSESVLDITKVNTAIGRDDPGIRLGPMRAEFYGGHLVADATVPSYTPFRMNLQMRVRGADVAKLAADRPFITRPPIGQLDAVLALTADRESFGDRPICAGRLDIRDGDLWDLPAFIGILATLSLTETGTRKLTGAQVEFTVERDRVRIDRMNFLGQPVNLFGDGTMALTGEHLDITMVPRIGKSWDDIVPLAGLGVQWLLDVLKGGIVPVRITGEFWAPKFTVGGTEVSQPVKEMIAETEKR